MVSKKFEQLMGLTQEIAPTRVERKPSEPKTAPGKMISALTGRDEALDRAEKAEAELDILKASLLIPLDQLVEVSGRKRNLSEQEYAELKANIRQHGLITPITVRRNDDSHYEVMSGHNRVRAFRDLVTEDQTKFSKIKAYLDNESDAAKADELAFYANLLHPDLPDFEKYRGLLKVRAANPHLTTSRALAEHVGMGEVQLGRLMKIGELPPDAQQVLEQNPRAFGSGAIAQFAQIAEQGRVEEVVQAMKSVVTDGIDQAKAVEMAAGVRKNSKPAQEAKPEVFTFKSGMKKYGSLRTVKNVIRIELADQEEIAEVQDILRNILEERAKAKKAGRSD
jgi:ParB family chromosome partitioning protein